MLLLSRKHWSIALSLLLVLSVFAGMNLLKASALQPGDVNVYIDGVQTFFPDQLPYIDENGRTMVPVRFCSLALGASVSWDDGLQQTTIFRPATDVTPARQVTLNVGSKELSISDQTPLEMDTAAVLSNGRTMVPLRFISEFFAAQVVWDAPSRAVHVFTQGQTRAEQAAIIQKTAFAGSDLPCINSAENLQRLLDEYTLAGPIHYLRLSKDIATVTEDAASVPAAPQAELSSNAKGMQNKSFSSTNIQVTGVDESDIVKTDGEYLYQVKTKEVIIVKACPPEEMTVVARLPIQERPREMYIDHNRLVIIQNEIGYHPGPVPQDTSSKRIVPDIYPQTTFRTLVTVFDTSDKKNPRKLDEYATPGSCLSSRKIGGDIYIVSTEGVYQPFEPVYSINNQEHTKTYDKIRYFPDMQLNSYMHLAKVKLDSAGNHFSLETFLGSGNNIYCSQDNLYIVATHYNPGYYREDSLPYGESTVIYKFALGEKAAYKNRGLVPGRILNQFSMDEYDGNFRIATTREGWNANGAGNAVYILNPRLKQIGAVENIAPGEQIYSVRFMGPKAYLVTFEQVDPLFVIDMNPSDPKILGKLKIPGFSNYLHPYKDNYLIGLGSEVEQTGKMTSITGIKLSLFNVADVSNPVEVDKVVIGVGGTSSPAADNHKAFMLFKDTLAFPATVYEGKSNHGSFAFQGAYVYNVSEQGFTLKGRITHLDEQDYLKAGDYWGGSNREIERIVCINDNLYTLSESMIKANQRDNLGELKRLTTD